jgi:hypothetical protein
MGHSFETKWGYRVEQSVSGAITCLQTMVPASDLLGRGRNMSDPMVASMHCYEDRGERRIAIGLTPWSPKRMPAALIENLRVLVSKAADRL